MQKHPAPRPCQSKLTNLQGEGTLDRWPTQHAEEARTLAAKAPAMDHRVQNRNNKRHQPVLTGAHAGLHVRSHSTAQLQPHPDTPIHMQCTYVILTPALLPLSSLDLAGGSAGGGGGGG